MSVVKRKLSVGLGLWLGMAGIVSAAETPAGPVKVVVTAKGCEPNDLTVAAGTTTFQIVNKSSRALEWEILKGVLVVDERENIAPGFTQKLTTRLDAGDYAITCGLVSNPQGRLTVTAGSGAVDVALRPTASDLIGPAAEYRVYLHGQTAALAAAASALASAVSAGDLPRAGDQFAAARAAYLRLKPATALFGDLDARIDGGPASEFQQLANGLAVTKSTDALGPVAASLTADVARVQAVLTSSSATPELMIKGAAQVIETIARETSTAATPDRLDDLRAKLAGARKVVDLFQPIAVKADKAGADRLQAELVEIEQTLQSASQTDADRKTLGEALTQLAGRVSKLRITLGLSQS